MEENEKICPSEELKKENAAFYKDGGFLWKSDSFLEMEEDLGEDLILESVKNNKVPFYEDDKEMYIYNYIATREEKYDILRFSCKKLVNRFESKDATDVMIRDIKNHVTNSVFQAETLRAVLSQKGMLDNETNSKLKHIIEKNVELWVRVMFVDLVREYELKAGLQCISDCGHTNARFIAKVFTQHLSSGLEDTVKTIQLLEDDREMLVRYLDGDHLRVILSLAVRQILEMSLKPDYINVEVSKKNYSTVSITVTGGSSQKLPADPKVLKKMIGTLKDLPMKEFVELFCQKYNCTVSSRISEEEYSMEIVMPAYTGVLTNKDKTAAKIDEQIKTRPSRFIPEFEILCDVVDYDKVKKEDE